MYKIEDTQRLKEIRTAFQNNVEASMISKIVVLSEPNDNITFDHNKVVIKKVQNRTRFSDFLPYLDPSEINIISNNDIDFSMSFNLYNLAFLSKSDIYCLTRWESSKLIFRKNEGDSQDAWIFRGNPSPWESCSFFIGFPGCDNRIAYEFFSKGYRVFNPSKSIKTFHIHFSNKRNYTEFDRLHGNYLNIKPQYLIESVFVKVLMKIISKFYKVQIS